MNMLKKNMLKNVIMMLFIAVAVSACANKSSRNDSGNAAADSVITCAKGISISHIDGYTLVSVKNPWKTGAVLQTYALVPRDAEVPASLPDGVTVVRTPLRNTVVYSSVHGSVMKELGELAAIRGVCDAEYFNMPEIQESLKRGKVVNVGNSQSPTIEKLIEMSPDAIILSPFQNAGYGVLTNLKVPIIECADYMEDSPLGRAEWIKFFGELFGKTEAADSIYAATVKKYNDLKDKASTMSRKPRVLTELLYSGVWYVPGGNSYMARMLEDAGAAYPWADDKSSGSLSLDYAQVLEKAGDADYWFIKPMVEMSYSSLAKENQLYTQIKAYKVKHIYQCMTVNSTFFQDFPFHPDVLLKDFIAIMHPELRYTAKYYMPVKDE